MSGSMAKKAAARTPRSDRATPVPAADLERYCRGLNDWPRSWMGWEKDLPPGEKLVACFRPFLEYLVTCADLSPKTIQKHVDNLWALGGEIIRALNNNPPLRIPSGSMKLAGSPATYAYRFQLVGFFGFAVLIPPGSGLQ